MTKPLRAAVEIIVETLQPKGRVLEIGSRQEKNQRFMTNLRPLFTDCEYIGTDMRKGPGVDRVVNGERLPFANNSFDVVICLETLEHARAPQTVCDEIQRVLKPKGIALVSSQQNFPIHLHPLDYFRYTPYGMGVLFGRLKTKLIFSISPPFDDEVKLNPQAVILVGSKSATRNLAAVKKALQVNKERISVHKPYRHRLQDGLKILRRAWNELFFRQELEFFDYPDK